MARTWMTEDRVLDDDELAPGPWRLVADGERSTVVLDKDGITVARCWGPQRRAQACARMIVTAHEALVPWARQVKDLKRTLVAKENAVLALMKAHEETKKEIRRLMSGLERTLEAIKAKETVAQVRVRLTELRGTEPRVKKTNGRNGTGVTDAGPTGTDAGADDDVDGPDADTTMED